MAAEATAFDAMIVGAGPAGLTAATYLGRFRRSVLVLDGGLSRADWIPESHNTPGFPAGVGGPELLRRMHEQAVRYGARLMAGRAEALLPVEGGFEVALQDGRRLGARHVLLATGILDRKPDVPDIDGAIRRSLVRICPICDAYEAIDRAIAVLGDGDLGAREALFLRHYSEQVTLLLSADAELKDRAALDAARVEVLRIDIGDLDLRGASVVLRRPDRQFDHLYLALGCEMESRLAVRWGAAHDDEGNLIVDAHQRTSVDGLYAAGDVVRGLNQIAVATAEAAIAATDIHNRLRGA